ncbi:MAG: hypothetical protein JKY22_09685 [Flavobacteriaceae bacterium]|nr:hypothetical protein [Flavobacteriaceae bacterium]
MIELAAHSQIPQNLAGYLSKNLCISTGTVKNSTVNFWKTNTEEVSVFISTEINGNKKGCQSIKMYTTNDTQWVLTLKLSQIIIRQTRNKLSRTTNFLNYIPMN